VYLQQFPYPCFHRDNFLSGLYTVQLLQVLRRNFFSVHSQVMLVFGFSVVVAIAVREFIWERESRNSQIIQVMGINPAVMWTSNFLLMLLVLTANALLLTLVFCTGGLLPKSDPSLVLLLFLNYGLSIIMFSFLLSVIMKKSTSGSVASFLLFILTFLPFLILISLSEDIHLVFRVICNLLMSTSFGLSFLYITRCLQPTQILLLARYEQQGIGLHWDNMATSPLEDDQLSFISCFLLLLLDSLLYGLLALLVSKLTRLDGSVRAAGSHGHTAAREAGRGIVARGLRREYRLGRGNVRVALEGLDVSSFLLSS
jgi:ATP-binding cassette subfamily A (ABC1) protein 3